MNTKTSTQMARLYGLKSSVAFNKLLVKCGILQHTVKGYVLADVLRGRQLVTTVDTWFFLPSGIKATKKTAAWTEQGQQYIHHRLAHIGILPTSEVRGLFN